MQVFESRENRLLHIDGLRALSVIWMIGFHTVWLLSFYIPKNEFLLALTKQQHFRFLLDGLLGVDVFFAISGFLIASILLKDIRTYGSVQFMGFYIRRVFRIIPAYLASVFLFMFLFGNAGMHDIWANIFLINNFFPIKEQPMGWTWSLAIEEQFYLLFPLILTIAFKVTRHPATLFFILTLCSLAFRYFVIHHHGIRDLLPYTPSIDEIGFSRWFDGWYDKTHLRCSGILIGILAAFAHTNTNALGRFADNRVFQRILLAFLGIYFVWSITSEQACVFSYCSEGEHQFYRVPYETLKHFMVSVMAASLILYCSGPGHLGTIDKILSSKIWRPFAELSLSAYLIHPIIITLLYRSSLTQKNQLSSSKLFYYLLIAESMTFSASFVMYLAVEMPFRKLGRRVAVRIQKKMTRSETIYSFSIPNK